MFAKVANQPLWKELNFFDSFYFFYEILHCKKIKRNIQYFLSLKLGNTVKTYFCKILKCFRYLGHLEEMLLGHW